MPRGSAPGDMPIQSAHAVAASTFSTLCWPRSGISASGQTGSSAAVEPGHHPAVADEHAVLERRGAG